MFRSMTTLRSPGERSPDERTTALHSFGLWPGLQTLIKVGQIAAEQMIGVVVIIRTELCNGAGGDVLLSERMNCDLRNMARRKWIRIRMAQGGNIDLAGRELQRIYHHNQGMNQVFIGVRGPDFGG